MEPKNNKGLIVALIAIIVLLLCAGVYLLFGKEMLNNKSDNNTTTAINNKDINNSTNKKIKDCTLSTKSGTTIALKNSTIDNYTITSDLYINNVFSDKVFYEDVPYNECEEIVVDESDNYILIKFATDWALYTNLYLFNKNGNFISDFSELKSKYDHRILIEFNKNGDLIFNYYADLGAESSIKESYCEKKAKPNDIYSMKGDLIIENNKLVEKNVTKTTWKNAYSCNGNNADECGNIDEIICGN